MVKRTTYILQTTEMFPVRNLDIEIDHRQMIGLYNKCHAYPLSTIIS